MAFLARKMHRRESRRTEWIGRSSGRHYHKSCLERALRRSEGATRPEPGTTPRVTAANASQGADASASKRALALVHSAGVDGRPGDVALRPEGGRCVAGGF